MFTEAQATECGLKRLAAMTLDVQDASNLTAVVVSFAEVIKALRLELQKKHEFVDDELLRSHPITVWWVSKLESLVNSPTARSHSDLVELAGRV